MKHNTGRNILKSALFIGVVIVFVLITYRANIGFKYLFLPCQNCVLPTDVPIPRASKIPYDSERYKCLEEHQIERLERFFDACFSSISTVNINRLVYYGTQNCDQPPGKITLPSVSINYQCLTTDVVKQLKLDYKICQLSIDQTNFLISSRIDRGCRMNKRH